MMLLALVVVHGTIKKIFFLKNIPEILQYMNKSKNYEKFNEELNFTQNTKL